MKILPLLLTAIAFSANAQQTNCLPDGDINSSEFIVAPGYGWESLVPQTAEFKITVDPENENVIVDFYNMNPEGAIYRRPRVTANWAFLYGVKNTGLDVQAIIPPVNGVLVPEIQNQILYELFGESSIPIAIVTGDGKGDFQFDNGFTVQTLASHFPSQSPDDFREYTVRMSIDVRNPEINNMYHPFKICANAPIKTFDQIGYVTIDWRKQPYVGIPLTMVTDRRIEIASTPQTEPDGQLCYFESFNGDCDKKTDDNDFNSPELSELPVNLTFEAIEQGINPGSPQDELVKVRLYNPLGNRIASDLNCSGTNEWEMFNGKSTANGCSDYSGVDTDFTRGELVPGQYTATFEQLLSNNVFFYYSPDGIESECNPEIENCNPEID